MRFLLGAAEAGFFPGVVFYLMQWFPAKRRARTMGRFYVSLPVSSAVMGALAGALLNLHGRLGLAGWQWLFLVEGIPPVLLGIVIFFMLPDSPAKASWLTAEEREWLQDQLRGDKDSHVHDANVPRALRDARVWLMGLMHLSLLIASYGFIFSAPVILMGLTGMSITNVGFLTSAVGMVGALVMLVGASHADRKGEHYWHIAIPCLLMAVAFAVAGIASAPVVVLVALIVAMLSFYFGQGSAWTIPFSFLKGKSAAAGIAAVGSIAIVGGFIGPYWMGLMKDFTGDYRRGLFSLALPCAIAAGLILIVRRKAMRQAAGVDEG